MPPHLTPHPLNLPAPAPQRRCWACGRRWPHRLQPELHTTTLITIPLSHSHFPRSYFLSTLFSTSRIAGTAAQLLYALAMLPGFLAPAIAPYGGASL